MDDYSTGWLKDQPDFRDYTLQDVDITPLSDTLKSTTSDKVDLRRWCSPIENQGRLGSCTANATMGLLEYFENRIHKQFINGSRLFLYKATRNLMKVRGDTGAYLRSTMGALVLFGVPPEEYWPYNIRRYDKEPPSFCYALAQNYQALKYFRLDPPGKYPTEVLKTIKSTLDSGWPSVFGFTIFHSFNQAYRTGKIPFPSRRERVLGGHAVMAVGYDDNLKITNTLNYKTTRGALLIRNSWSTRWGDDGYGWLPYDYVLKGLAVDWWSLLDAEWIDMGSFRSES